MNKVLKFGLYFGVAVSVVSCSTSEHFMQDDVYNTRSPMMPPGTDLNDVTDYATFVAKKEQSESPEQTAYVTPRQYNDFFYNSQYVFYGYSAYPLVTGIGYAGYTGIYYNPMYGYRGTNMSYGYPYGYSTAFYGFGFGSGYTPPIYGGYYYGNTSWYAPVNKPNTAKNLSSSNAGSSAGRMGSTTNGGIVNYQNKMIAKPTNQGYSGAGRNTTVNAAPVVNSTSSSSGRNSSLQARPAARPVIAGRPSASGSASARTITNSNTTVESTNSNAGSGRTFTNSSGTRTSTPSSVRSSGNSSGGSVSTPSTGGGSRSGGRR